MIRLQNSSLALTEAAAACHGMMPIPSPKRTIALMISTFWVSITMSGSIRSRMKNSSTRCRVTDPASKRMNGCPCRSAGRIFRFFRQRMRWIGDEQQLFLEDGLRRQIVGLNRQCDQPQIGLPRAEQRNRAVGAPATVIFKSRLGNVRRTSASRAGNT